MGENSSSSDYTKQIDDKFTKAIQNAASGTKKNKLKISTLPVLSCSGAFDTEYSDFLMLDNNMPPKTSNLWKTPIDTIKYFQINLRKNCKQNDSDIVDVFQLIHILPLLRVNELLCIVDNKAWLITQCFRLFMIHAYNLQYNQPIRRLSKYPRKIVYVVNNEKTKLKSYKDLVKSKCIQHAVDTYFTKSDRALFMRSLTESEGNPVIDLKTGQTEVIKLITIMTHIQAGDYIKKHGTMSILTIHC